eukprot:SAG11_NODE_994_length_6261_cov_10.558747_3_plen_98_part_00
MQNWTPVYRIINVTDRIDDCPPTYYTTVYNGEWYVVMESEHICRLYENLELENFPHDCQELTIKVESCLHIESCRFVPLQDTNQPAACMVATERSDG